MLRSAIVLMFLCTLSHSASALPSEHGSEPTGPSALSPVQPPLTVPGFHGLRIPTGGVDRGAQPGGGGRILLYTYSETKESLSVRLRAQLKQDGWQIVSDQRSPRGTARLTVSKSGVQIRISITGHGPQSALILSR
ncbi:MAG: hypothetical protein KC609_14400 [Myxococcales bacterium]|nr:hypothetical protein [Myxococcales bacterium]